MGLIKALSRLKREQKKKKKKKVVGGGARLGMVFGWSMQIWVRGGLSWVWEVGGVNLISSISKLNQIDINGIIKTIVK